MPNHALVATPGHGVVASLSSLTVSVAVNKVALLQEFERRGAPALPWTGNLHVNGDDGATIAVKVRWAIRFCLSRIRVGNSIALNLKNAFS